MFAIVEIAGSQHKVKKGDILSVEKQLGKEGEKLATDKVLLKFDGKTAEVGTPYLKGAKVEYTIQTHGRGEKIRVFKKKSKKRFQKTQGHRQSYSRIEITAVH
ncbi:MAG: 50S ribosomal protein L21 [Candidatus Peregrinibacteria bacterium]